MKITCITLFWRDMFTNGVAYYWDVDGWEKDDGSMSEEEFSRLPPATAEQLRSELGV